MYDEIPSSHRSTDRMHPSIHPSERTSSAAPEQRSRAAVAVADAMLPLPLLLPPPPPSAAPGCRRRSRVRMPRLPLLVRPVQPRTRQPLSFPSRILRAPEQPNRCCLVDERDGVEFIRTRPCACRLYDVWVRWNGWSAVGMSAGVGMMHCIYALAVLLSSMVACSGYQPRVVQGR